MGTGGAGAVRDGDGVGSPGRDRRYTRLAAAFSRLVFDGRSAAFSTPAGERTGPAPGQTQEPGPAPRPSAGPPRPAPGPAGKTVLLRYGDTLYGLAGHHGTTVKALQRLNGLGSSTLIYAGDTLRVPTARDTATDTPSAARSKTSAGAPEHEDRSRESGVRGSRW
ncbi:LysM peptidoglycan-binding domain-containing protein [Streptomyces sp. NPDC056441]|uniref:LysM peptidoglycan-binding domain-containing protein n=1 Tax=Streptomyces sp. NPDC056441 TaxID=3345817 RepID=UPI0036963E54